MAFKINVHFVEFNNNLYKEEFTDNWQQAFGAFTIYVSDPDCVCCKVTYIDKNEEKIVLTFSSF